MRVSGKTDEEVDAVVESLVEAVEAFSAGEDVDADRIEDLTVRMLLKQLLAAPGFSRPVMVFSPTEAIASAPVPVLVVNGERDLQIDADADYEPLLAAGRAAGRTITGIRSEKADHVLKVEERPLAMLKMLRGMVAMGYNQEGRVLDPVIVDGIAAWLRERTSP